MDIRTQSALLAAIIAMALGVSMLLRAQRPRVLTLYGIFALSIGGFYFARFLEWLFPWEADTLSSVTGRVVLGLTITLGAVVPSTALAFFLEFLNLGART